MTKIFIQKFWKNIKNLTQYEYLNSITSKQCFHACTELHVTATRIWLVDFFVLKNSEKLIACKLFVLFRRWHHWPGLFRVYMLKWCAFLRLFCTVFCAYFLMQLYLLISFWFGVNNVCFAFIIGKLVLHFFCLF